MLHSAFDWDEANVEHIAEHGVEPEEAEEALLDPGRQVRNLGIVRGERRWAALGRTSNGRLLEVIFTHRRDMSRVVTATDATEKEKRHYRRRGRRK